MTSDFRAIALFATMLVAACGGAGDAAAPADLVLTNAYV
jgi:hypothetical protein